MPQQNGLTAHQNAVAAAERSVGLALREAKPDPLKPKLHFSAPAYWINDPNGLIHYKDEYHLFYQFYPYGNRWGAMHWGHAKSKDLVHWEHLPIALAPSEEYDLHERGGCFSGSAVNDNGILSLLYTGTVIRDGQVFQTQCLATSRDGITFEKYEGNPVISAPPEDGSADFRDPKVWKHDGTWYMVVGSSNDGKGKALLYRSPDLRKWDYIGVLAESDGTLGTMWECPDFFSLGDKYVLMFSPMGMGEHQAIYLIGDMDYATGTFTWDTMGETDAGFDYYAPQSLLDASGRRIIIAWLNAWDWMPWFKDFAPPKVAQWCGSMSIPRVVGLNDEGRLRFTPVEEMKTLRGDHYHAEQLRVEAGRQPLPATNGDAVEIVASFRLSGSEATRFGLLLRASEDGSAQTVLAYDPETKELSFDRSRSDGWSEGLRSVRLERMEGDRLTLHLYVDTSNIEVYTERYGTAMTFNIYPEPANVKAELFADGGSVTLDSLDVWQLRSIW